MSSILNATTSATGDGYYLGDVSANFETGAVTMMGNLKSALTDMENDPSDPTKLAKYQACLQEYTLFRNAQSSTIKAYSSIGATIIQNFR
ncbi:type III secretion system major needle protein, YscF/MxiH/PrgI family [Izhakiella capsodis]|uniref:Type III secretion system major needle protein, YscF/MxiH/PrgI family n=1 Tax=Izhakiella capsodis TaxID=1367852 RepID=A0A1I5AUL0_9GAMM|nr:type III secretion system needle filament subunit SctF [Izhakiella capsodis]SFN66216.1 type III secretion system major needle protein, YscF/MxiH/PrgI family [Izhakiella capsodis]